MTNNLNLEIEKAKSKLSEQTTKLEDKVKDFWNKSLPNYTNLEPWKRGLLLIGLVITLALALYYLTHESQDKKSQKKAQAEAELEAKLLRRMEVLKKLRE